ncbi:MAG: GGDEF domain-containing protein [Bdellovibrionaceae bacterium]|nr:GGDEF domain-containing protein [Pseudobdellovibrionaceae bacterium]
MTAVNKKSQIIIWPTYNSTRLQEFLHSWPKMYQFTIVKNWKEFIEHLNRDDSFAVFIETTPTDNREDIFSFAKQNKPELLRFQIVNDPQIKQSEDLLGQSLIHKTLNLTAPNDNTKLSIQETLALFDLVEERNRFAELSITDPVTQLTNHRFFQEKLRQELQKAKKNKESLALVMIDVDHFKLLNDQYGHPRGDQVLALLAKELKRILPASASLSRYGGEEFSLILPKTTSPKALQISEELRASVLALQNLDFRLSISLGIACFPEHGLDVDELIANADHALYCAKRQGRNMSIVAGDFAY